MLGITTKETKEEQGNKSKAAVKMKAVKSSRPSSYYLSATKGERGTDNQGF
jgi:hypothetical protein